MDLKTSLNLNTYQWWRNHRRFITLGIFLALFAGYLRGPEAKDLKIKETCSKVNVTNGNEIEQQEALKIIGLKDVENIISFCAYYTK
tara:strand:+ start:21655 stop:21915 length:261 start_codon:yes stop_codon:yes gene_type:complete